MTGDSGINSATAGRDKSKPCADLELDLAIIGAGLCGLSLATRLSHRLGQLAVFEARERFGGRILSLPLDRDFRYDLGPGWVWPELQPRIAHLIARQNQILIPQWYHGTSFYQDDRLRPAQAFADQGAYAMARRIHGGMQCLIEGLLQTLPASCLYAGHRLRAVIEQQDHVELWFDGPSAQRCVKARQVAITIPPRLLIETVHFSPALDPRLSEIMRTTPTWMAGHAKVVVCYEQAFWREAGLSGAALSVYPGAALMEIFDASASDGTHAALSGFVGIPSALRRRDRAELEAQILSQLVRLFGKDAAATQSIVIQDWCDERYTATREDAQLPDGHPQYGHAWLQQGHWHNKLFFGGTETAAEFGGYLEGALESCDHLSSCILGPDPAG